MQSLGCGLVVLVGLAPGAALAAVPPDLDPTYRHQKRLQVEASAYVGTYLGATLRKSWLIGARAQLHLSDWLSFGGSYGFSRHAVNLLGSAGDVLREHQAHYLDGELSLSTDVALRMGRRVIQLDLYTTLGLGARELDGGWGLLGVIAGGVRFYTGLPWLAVRIDVYNYLHRLELASGGQVDVDVSFQLGVSFLFPTRAPPPRPACR